MNQVKKCFRVNITVNIVISIYIFIFHINEEITVHTTMQTDNKNQMLK